METSNPNPASLIPAAHIPSAIAAAGNNQGVLAQLQSLQAQLNALMGIQSQQNLADVILVNEYGRIVEVDGKTAMELLSKPGFRRATTDEEERYRKAILRQTPAYLRRMEAKRLQDEKAILDELELEDAAGVTAVNPEDLLRAPVTDAQKSGTPAPAAVPQGQSESTTQTTQTTDDQKNNNVEAKMQTEESTPRPPSRRARSAANDNSSSQQDSTSQSSSNSQDDDEAEEEN